MKKIKPYNVFNESLRDKIKGKDNDEIKNKILNMEQDELNKTLISFLHKNYNDEIIKLLIENGADVNFDDGAVIKNYLHNKNINMIKYLLDNHDVDIESSHSFPLRYVASVGDYEMTKLFLEYGADPNCEDDDAIEMAEDNGHDDVLELLKEYANKN